jgi:hypothetical protein
MNTKNDLPRGDEQDDPIEPIRSHSITSSHSKPLSILQPLGMEEAPLVRTKLKVMAILTALYVSWLLYCHYFSYPLTSIPALVIHSCARSDHHSNRYPYNSSVIAL